MSIEIDWSLLSSVSSGESLATSLLAALNRQLETASRPSFLGPISITEFDFGTVGPEVEIRDVGDVWKVFEENECESEEEHAGEYPVPHTTGPDGPIADSYDGFEDGWDHDDETTSVLSGMLSPRAAMARMGGAGIGIGAGMGINLASGFMNPSLYSHSRSQSHRRNTLNRQTTGRHNPRPGSFTHTPPMTIHPGVGQETPMETPTPPPQSQPLPSLQLLVHLDHQPDMCITMTTSLQINYPSPMFMTLPLKLRITGFTLSADIVFSFNGPKKRVHVCLLDEHDPATPTPALTYAHSATSPDSSYPSTPAGPRYRPLLSPDMSQAPPYDSRSSVHPPKPIGHRLLPALQIESEIGRADIHALRNVGKVENFILDLVRKTLVDELVFPNYHTVAL